MDVDSSCQSSFRNSDDMSADGLGQVSSEQPEIKGRSEQSNDKSADHLNQGSSE